MQVDTGVSVGIGKRVATPHMAVKKMWVSDIFVVPIDVFGRARIFDRKLEAAKVVALRSQRADDLRLGRLEHFPGNTISASRRPSSIGQRPSSMLKRPERLGYGTHGP